MHACELLIAIYVVVHDRTQAGMFETIVLCNQRCASTAEMSNSHANEPDSPDDRSLLFQESDVQRSFRVCLI